MMQPQATVDRLRLALSPILDGVVMEGEWDLLAETSGGPVFFQWEPGAYHWAAKPRPGFDVVFSLDANGDGWLAGTDNLEIRASLKGSTPVITLRQLDASNRDQPKWVSPTAFPEALTVIGKPSTDYWNIEGKFEPIQFCDPPALDSQPGVRVDVVPSEMDLGPAYTPRHLTPLRMRYEKSRNLFSGLTWRPQVRSRSVARVDRFMFRFNFETAPDCPKIQSIDIFGEGYAKDALIQVTKPFPSLDRRGNAMVDFHSDVEDDAPGGWRVLRATLLSSDGQLATIRTSFRIADLLDIEFGLPQKISPSAESQRLRGSVTLRSQATGRIDGDVTLTIPQQWSFIKGAENRFLIYHARGTSRFPVEISVPGGVRGVHPIYAEAKIGERRIRSTHYVWVR